MSVRRTSEVRIPYKYGQTFRFVPFGDLHLGHKLSAEDHFRENVVNAYRDDPDTYFFDMGDGIDFDAYRRVGDKLIDRYVELLWPIKDRILVMMDSNHSQDIGRHTECTRRTISCVAYRLWDQGPVEQKIHGDLGFIRTVFSYDNGLPSNRVRSLTWLLNHVVQTDDARKKEMTIKDRARRFEADVLCFADRHRLEETSLCKTGMGKSKTFVNRMNRNITNSWERIMSTGSYMKKRPGTIGHGEVLVTIKQHFVDTCIVLFRSPPPNNLPPHVWPFQPQGFHPKEAR